MENNTTTIHGKELPISTKQSVEVCSFIRDKNLAKAKNILNLVIEKKVAVPYKRYKKDIPHRKGKIAAGRFPVKTSKEILKILKGIESNAQQKGLDVNNLVITHISAHHAANQFHYGRRRRIKMKRTNIDIIVEERVQENKPRKENKKK